MDPTDAIKRFEGFTPRAAWDYKQHSVGYGTKAQYPGEVIDKEEGERRLAAELAAARAIVDRAVPNADPGTKAALTSLTFNSGAKWATSGLGDAVRAGDLDKARELFVQYNRAGGQVLPGLVNRRGTEVTWIGNAGDPQSPPTRSLGDMVALADSRKPVDGQFSSPLPTPPPTQETPPATPGGASGGILPQSVASAFGFNIGAPEKPAQRQANDLPDPLGADDLQSMQMPAMRNPAARRIAIAAMRQREMRNG